MPLKTPQCVYEVNVGLFRVLQNKGKSFSSGGYGVMYNMDKLGTTTTNGTKSKQQIVKQTNNSLEDDTLFLFLEEALFLKERSLLHVLKNDEVTPYTTAELYRIMLQEHQIPLQVYLTYAHLRSQTFIVIRHTPDRIDYIHGLSRIHHKCSVTHNNNNDNCNNNNKNNENKKYHDKKSGELSSKIGDEANDSIKSNQNTIINQGGETIITNNNQHKPIPNDDAEKVINQMVETKNDNSNNNTRLDWKEKRKQKKKLEQTFKKEFRRNSIEAPVPTVFNHKDESMNIAFDVYKPNASFSKMNPGVPDFYVAILNFAELSPPFATMMKAVKDCNDVTLRLATITDTGTVMIFGVTDFGVPSID